MKRAEPYIADGHFSLASILLPLAFFALLFVVWHVCGFRGEAPMLPEDDTASIRDIKETATSSGVVLPPVSLLPLTATV
jgi:hypothetical protein